MQFFSKNDISRLKQYWAVKENPWKYEEELWKKVERYKKIFHYVPWILCVCVCNSLAMHACHKDSDIDLFVITQKNRLWTVRIIITFIFALLGERKTSKSHAGKFCLSFFVTEEALDFSVFAIERDIYLAYWIETLVPVYNPHQCFERFLAENTWYEFEEFSAHQKVFGASRSKNSLLWNLLESFLKKIFLPRTQKSFQKLWKPFGVIISDTMLKFHNNDQRKVISEKVFQETFL